MPALLPRNWLLQAKAVPVPAPEPDASAAYSKDFINRRLLVFAGIVVG